MVEAETTRRNEPVQIRRPARNPNTGSRVVRRDAPILILCRSAMISGGSRRAAGGALAARLNSQVQWLLLFKTLNASVESNDLPGIRNSVWAYTK